MGVMDEGCECGSTNLHVNESECVEYLEAEVKKLREALSIHHEKDAYEGPSDECHICEELEIDTVLSGQDSSGGGGGQSGGVLVGESRKAPKRENATPVPANHAPKCKCANCWYGGPPEKCLHKPSPTSAKCDRCSRPTKRSGLCRECVSLSERYAEVMFGTGKRGSVE